MMSLSFLGIWSILCRELYSLPFLPAWSRRLACLFGLMELYTPYARILVFSVQSCVFHVLGDLVFMTCKYNFRVSGNAGKNDVNCMVHTAQT